MIYDCFTFFNELDILEMRLEELYPVVDRFVIVEGSQTFQGADKPDYAWENLHRFENYADKMIFAHCDYSCMPPANSAWDREYGQRNHIGNLLHQMDLSDDDIILLSDADEIPRRSVVESLDPQPVQSIALQAYYYGLNTKADHQHTIRAARWDYAKIMTMQQLRTLDPPPNIVYDGGWHFSYLGDAEHIANKFRAFAHAELNRPDTTDPAILQARMEARGDLWGDGHTYETVEIDDTWPEAVKNNREYWSKYEWQKTSD